VNGFRGAVGFLTRVPVAASIQNEAQIARAVPWFPVVGAAVGLSIACIYAASLLVLPPLVAATVAIAAGLLITGAFHEDGLADVLDAFWGGWDREQRLRILKDPRLGTYGVLAIVVTLLLKVGVVSSLDTWTALVLLPAAHALSRASAIFAMTAYPAVAEGLGASYIHALTARQARAGMIAGVALSTIVIGWWVIPAALFGWLGARVVGAISMRKIAGVTGDVLGTIQQVSEILILLMGAALTAFGHPFAWWNQ
jgi:adenosylcobinamide-GDP ribazoletransferase